MQENEHHTISNDFNDFQKFFKNFECDYLEKSKSKSYVYFITDFNGNTKVGRSEDPIYRAKSICTISNKLVFPVFINQRKLGKTPTNVVTELQKENEELRKKLENK